MTMNLAQNPRAHDDVALAAMAEWIECRAWMDIVAATPDWLRRATGLAIGEADGAIVAAGDGVATRRLNACTRLQAVDAILSARTIPARVIMICWVLLPPRRSCSACSASCTRAATARLNSAIPF